MIDCHTIVQYDIYNAWTKYMLKFRKSVILVEFKSSTNLNIERLLQ